MNYFSNRLWIFALNFRNRVKGDHVNKGISTNQVEHCMKIRSLFPYYLWLCLPY